MKYSIILPAYNAETTLCSCLDSLVVQLPPDAELLLINDGSTDGTEAICRLYAEQYPQIRYFPKENGGVSSARNLGLSFATGEYILFVDADDAVSTEYFSVLTDALRDSPDLLLFRKQLMGRQERSLKGREQNAFYTDISKISSVLAACLRKQELNLITTKAFRREIIEAHGIRFDERLDIGEDKVFSFNFSLHTTQVKVISNALYYLSVDDPDSLSRRKREHLCDSVLLEHRLMSGLLAEAELPEDCIRRYQNAISYSFYRSAYTVVGKLRKDELSASERQKKARAVLEQYAGETGYPIREFSSRVISIPVCRRQACLIDKVMGCYTKRGYR